MYNFKETKEVINRLENYVIEWINFMESIRETKYKKE